MAMLLRPYPHCNIMIFSIMELIVKKKKVNKTMIPGGVAVFSGRQKVSFLVNRIWQLQRI